MNRDPQLAGRPRCPICEAETGVEVLVGRSAVGPYNFCLDHARQYWGLKRSELPDWVAQALRWERRRRDRRMIALTLDTDYNEADLSRPGDTDEFAAHFWEDLESTDGGMVAAEAQVDLAELMRDASLSPSEVACLALRMLGWSWEMVVTTGAVAQSLGNAGNVHRRAVEKMRAASAP